MASGGYGRGGRGAALLEALNAPVRKPGGMEEKLAPSKVSQPGILQTKSQPPEPPVASQPPPPKSIARGRGALGLLASAAGRGILPPKAQPAGTTPAVTPTETSVQPRGVEALFRLTSGRGGMMAAAAANGGQQTGLGQPLQQMPSKQSPPASLGQSPPATQQATVKAPAPVASMGKASGERAPLTSRFNSMSLDRDEVVHRPGSVGKHLLLSANYIKLRCLNSGVYQYHVDFSPQVDSKNMRFKMMSELKDIIGSTKAFDGSILYLPIKLPNQETVAHSTRLTDNVDITITIRLTKVVAPEACVPLYNIIFRKIMRILEMVEVGRYYYNPKTPSAVPQHKLEVWPGYITSVCENEGGLMLLADASHRVLRTETVLQMLHTILQRNPQSFHDVCNRTLIGTIILTRYNNKTYRIDDILWDKSPQHTFTCGNTGEPMTFIEYYKKAYNKTISDHEQPLLLHRPKRKTLPGNKEAKSEAICLIPELCYGTGLTDELRNDFKVMKDIACHTRVTPNQRNLTMKKFIDSVNGNPDAKKELSNWGLELMNDTLSMDGRLLPQENIIYRNYKSLAGPNADWGRDVTKQHVITAVPLKNWVVLYTKRDGTKASNYIKQMLQCCPQMGIECHPPVRFELHDDRTETVIRTLRENINPSIQMVVIICPTSRDDRYSAIKKLCCSECPVPSQVIIAKTIMREDKLRSVTQKIALQINCKMGGELWALEIPMKKLMVIGIDVYHDAAKGKRSIAGFVASTNPQCTTWYSRVCFQMPGQELVDGLKLCLISAIRKYHEVNHVFPEKIIVFRDGVSDGQLQFVSGHEVEQLKGCFSQFGEDYQPRLGVVIVQKRINSRIFLKGNHEMENPPSGTVVDHTITRREWYDYFLVSQHVRQGTVSPTHYIVVHDSTNLKPDHMQRLSYKMTHLYYNWPGTIRVPAPCQYAHKLAYLVGQNIHKEPAPELSDRLFFL
ncbi:piwi-like protein 1 [Ylistrum balloti]|uniref:piwi-like protein 1 n=1 Tax=Ylistrum balloti TaxID=509963 RepID=UPI002905AF45|nr:piwi-like protein 1 [Ylistrum balloti]